SGAIMAADNVLAIFLLPLFGSISDRCSSKMGRRKPFILFGTVVSVILMIFIPIMDNSYFKAPSAGKTALFIIILGALLVAMGTYRSPAVALMPDVTPKPLRSKGNAVINLMGALGGILYLVISAVMYSKSKTEGLSHVDYLPIFVIVGGIMILALLILLFTVDEVKLTNEVAEYEKAHPEEDLTVNDGKGNQELPKEVKRSLTFLLFSIALWFISYNAVETWFTTYANRMWGMALGNANTCLLVANAGAILSYIPIGAIASKIGRKKTILSGVIIMTADFAILFAYTYLVGEFSYALFILFFLLGLAWAGINVNSLPMVLEMCKGSDIGKFTGYYYTFSMAAQIVTPILAGFLLRNVSYSILFIYAAVFMGAALITMLNVRHGDSKVIDKKGLEAFDVED
ncbi:MAG: MFS transporter, partial [Lachnospiraceae bacterium]|nr:MFS transporter [Lachnospiraceae bacterium]